MEILAKLGIDPYIMLAQAVNFFILLGLLSFFVYKPIQRMLKERAARIEKAEENAVKVAKSLEKTEKESAKKLEAAGEKARSMMDAAKKQAKKLEDELRAEAKETISRETAQAREAIAAERAAALADIEKKAGSLIAMAAEKAIQKTLSSKEIDDISKKAAADIAQIS